MSMESGSAGVVVVGAGPSGLVASSALRAAGVDVRTLDAAPAPATTSRALGLQPRGIEVLDRIGALGSLRESAVPLSRSIFRINGRYLVELSWVNAGRSGPAFPLIISQADIEASLRNRLTAAGGTVEWNQRVVSVDDTGERASARLADGTVIHADWVIGADGAHSIVRKAAGIDFPGVPRVERLLIADVCADLDSPRDAVVFFAGPTGLLGAFPLPGDNVWRLMAPAPGADRTDLPPEAILGALEAGLAQHAGGVVRSVAWASSFRVHRRLADSYRRGRLLLVGDAAHIHSPVGAQGLNTGIGDAENLAWKLTLVMNGRAHEDLLDSYEAERRPIAAEVLSNTGDVTDILAGTGLMTRLIRDHAMVPILRRRWVQRHIADKASQLSVTYRKGPLGSTRRLRACGIRSPGLRPGDRVPDAEFTCENGDVARLFTLLGPGWALLGRDTLGAVAKARLGDVAVLPGDDDALLVRPDGHLAWRGRDPGKLAEWLDITLGQSCVVRAVSAR
ncbi:MULTISPECIES: FAD-dependent monooxygenase [unclassified Mycobacterium]|uniref:FAD-dependent monooxygenase n=1 Tax=unclassified Mycobacterium TaxID=2642494 RepID=UPI0029C6CFA2|nr:MULTISPECIES: FAD-dependent monooxygenase [unclassified Mycobacterium]